MKDAAGKSRVAQVVDVVGLNKAIVGTGWAPGRDYSPNVRWQFGVDGNTSPGTLAQKATPKEALPDPNGHGTVVASIAAGRGSYQTPDSTGVAPGATLYDVRVLDERGVGTVADLLVGIDWVLQRARLHNIRVMNMSLAANGTDSFLLDPLARAARSAVAAGIVVVASASNAGKNDAGAEVYGAISSPGIEPSVITVGAANPVATPIRSDDLMAGFSSRGPTRGSVPMPGGKRWFDNVLKPDLVAPGNRLLGAVANKKNQAAPSGNVLASLYPSLMQGAQAQGAAQVPNEELMQLSGTSVAAPAVAARRPCCCRPTPD
jgi:subtilisin family serine protease